MALASLNISLPQSMKDFVEEQVSQRGYSTPSEYVRDLVRRDQKQAAEDKLTALLLEGLEPGEPVEGNPEYWEAKRRQLIVRSFEKSAGR